MYPRVGEKRRIDDINLEDEEAIGSLCRLSGRPVSPKSAMEHEKRMRREIANSNERRRMQSINAGFASLKTLLPHHEGEKLSKAAILQQTAEYIYQLEQEKTRLLAQNCQLKRLLNQQHHSDPEGSPTGGDSPNEDRSLNTASPPLPTPITSTTLTTPVTVSTVVSTPSANPGADLDDFRREAIDTRMHVDRERRQRIKLDEHIRGHEAEIYTEKEICRQVKYDYAPRENQSSGVKIEIKNEEEGVLCGSLSTTVVTDSQMDMTCEHSDYADVQEIHVHKSIPKATEIVPNLPSRVSIPIGATTNVCTSLPSDASFRTSHTQQSSSVLSPNTTILTVLPSNKDSGKALPPVLELRGLSEVEETEVSSPTATVEYVEDGSLRNHTVYIVNSSNSCQKSLDTICEAIRHLEGDHMFPLEEQSSSNIKEEVVTDETYTVEEEPVHHTVPQDIHHQHHSTIVTGSYDSNKGSSSPSIHASHPLGSSMGRLTLHMIPEPQEVPLELTTTHRASSEPHQYINHDVVCSSPQHVISSHPTTLLHHTTRPGVIVVKHQS